MENRRKIKDDQKLKIDQKAKIDVIKSKRKSKNRAKFESGPKN